MLVSAPAGFGKTTLLVDWMAALAASDGGETSTAWLSLDAGDNDPATYWTYLVNALRTAVPGVGADALGLLREPQPPPIQLVLTALLGFVALLHYRKRISKVIAFWTGFVLIQPFGATAGDLWTKKPSIGGMGFPTYYASAILAAVLVAFVVISGSRSISALLAFDDCL